MIQRIYQHLISWFMGKLAQWSFPPFKNWAIRRLIRNHKVDLEPLKESNLDAYKNFNQFFIRELKPEARPLSQNPLDIASPAEGFISQVGTIDSEKIIQAKDTYYSVSGLIGRDAAQFGLDSGHFVNIYLSPKDYHRVHMPMTGKLKEMIYIPGSLFSVSPAHVKKTPGLFSKNERVVLIFELEDNAHMAVVLVGAISVGKIKIAWEKHPIGSFFEQKTKSWDYSGQNKTIKKGEELGYFLLGSTAIALFSHSSISWNQTLKQDTHVKVRETIGHL